MIRNRYWAHFGRLLVAPLLVAFFVAPPVCSQQYSQQYKRERKSAYSMLVHRLEGAVKECKRHKLHAERKRVSELLLNFDEENSHALLGAGYRKSRGGDWSPPRASKTFEDAEAPEELARIREDVRAAMGEFVQRLEQLLDIEGLTEAQLEELSGDIVAVDPRNRQLRRVRGERGEVRFGGQWILEETMTGLDGRALLREMGEDARRQAEYTGEVLEVKAMGLEWQLASPQGAQVFVTTDAEEARQLAEIVARVALVFEWFFGKRVSYPPRCRFFAMQTTEKATFLEQHPNVGAERKAQFDGLELTGIQGSSDQAFFADSAEQRADAVARMCLLWFFQSGFGIGMDKGWVSDGLGIYLTEALLDTRLTWFHSPLSEGSVQWGELVDPEASWASEAAKLFAAEEDLDLTPTLNKPQKQFTARDLLIAYAFVSYVAEVHHGILPAALHRIGADKPAGPTFQQAGELILGELPKSIRRWLVERQRMPDVIFARKNKDSMRLELAKLSEAKQSELARAFTARLQKSDTDLAHLLQRYRGASVRSRFPAQLEYYEPEVYAPGLPIGRTRLAPDDFRLTSLRRRVQPDDERRAVVAYDFAQREIRGAASDGLETNYERTVGALLEGRVPYYDLARAAILEELDDGKMREYHEAFSHAYTDREGNVYSGISLYDVWSSGALMEMPDVDVLGILHNLVGDMGVASPIPASAHTQLYKRVGKLFEELRPYRPLREALADTWLLGKPSDPDYKSYEVALSALWIECDADPSRLVELIASEPPSELLHRWDQRCREDRDLWLRAKRRGIERKRDLLMLRSVLVDALGDVGVLEASAAR